MERRKYICIFFGMLVKDEEIKGEKLVKGGEVVLILEVAVYFYDRRARIEE